MTASPRPWAIPVLLLVDPVDRLDDALVETLAARVADDPAPPHLNVRIHLMDRPGGAVFVIYFDESALPTADEQDTVIGRVRRLIDGDGISLLPVLDGADPELLLSSTVRFYDSAAGWADGPPRMR